MKRLFWILFCLCVLAVAAVAWPMVQPLQLGTEQVEIDIPAGATPSGAVDVFASKGLLTWPPAAHITLNLYARLSGNHLNRGRFVVRRDQSQFEALRSLFRQSGQAATVNVTIPEGLTIGRTASILARAGLVDSTQFAGLAASDSAANKMAVLEGFGIAPAADLEGFLMPDTYNFYQSASVRNVLDKLVGHHAEFWTAERIAQAKKLNMSLREVATLASIIEAETPTDAEKPRVSGVYHNRLKAGMLLQADPTVQFALGDVRRRLLYDDLEYDSPYNTYKYTGLPPGPINSPGRIALDAALNPEKHSYYYFVALGDGSGKHDFSRTKLEHDRAVQRYRRSRGR